MEAENTKICDQSFSIRRNVLIMTRITLLLLVHAFSATQCANILGVTSMISHSHHLWNEKLAEGLLKNGHNVTLLSHDKAKIKHMNYTVIQLEGGYEKIHELFDYEESFSQPESADISNFWKVIGLICAHDLSTEGLKTLMKYPEDYKFDLIIWDLNSGECLYPLIKRFGNPPVVGVSPFGLQPYISYMMGSHYFNYIPFYGTSYTGGAMSFWERISNTLSINYLTYVRINSYLPTMQTLAYEHFGSSLTEPALEVERNFSLALVNSDAIFNFPEALAPNIIPVGGLHIEPAKPIQKDLRKVFESTNGVIIFSLGSNIQAEFLNDNMMNNFNRCFETLPYTFILKYNNTHQRKFPKNVITRPWLQINDILGHPKTKLFISHGGALSTQEAMYHGVPIVGIPFFVDQLGNIAKLVERKIAERLEFDKLSPEYICQKIKTVLENSTYYENVQLISRRVKDQQNTPLQRAVFWIEYILRNGNGEHLSLAARDMYTFQTLNIDIIGLVAVLIATALLLVYLVYIIFLKQINKVKVD
ncbi:PREDICTED: UDP-glucuronosyltransferase 2B10-like [Nicrophorus vespilloides]|uniref:UDP-glucuronosyltransferase 2B10-like n=1 Tax=Nicrophorus vespilloides TaxID=110193 RepID=A0ABM1MV36_NICVS|nr:PREDICTED: UDP-glucuronosyltransferase 2B10-like [Nicrophorus vespilloides]